VYRRAMGFRWPRRTSREFGSSVHMPGFLSPRHPPSTRALARSRHRDERQGQHSTRRTLMMPRNGIICERVRAPAEHAIRRRPVLRERAAGVRLRLRLRHRSCSTTWSFEARLHELRSPGHHSSFRESRCASCSCQCERTSVASNHGRRNAHFRGPISRPPFRDHPRVPPPP
jgi:hypothetical protein